MEGQESTVGKAEHSEPLGADAEALLEALRVTSDLSSGSDEVFLLMTSPWRRMVLSSRRTLLLSGLQLNPGSSVLEVGPGAGSLTRWLLEQGHRVVAVARSEIEHDLVAARCAGLSALDLRLGGLDVVSAGDRFDAVIHVPLPVDELAPVDAASLVALASRALHDGGSLVWSIRNPTGVDAICGLVDAASGMSRHALDRPESTLNGSEGLRHQADELLASESFTDRRWGGVFPNERVPSVVIHDELLADAGSTALVDQLAGPTLRALPGSLMLSDPRRVLRRLCDAGMGAVVAPGWLVVASRTGTGPADTELGQTMARFCGSERLRPWQRELRVGIDSGSPGGLVVERRRMWPEAGLARQSWLSNELTERAALIRGFNLEQTIVEAVAAGDLDELRAQLLDWYAWLEVRAIERTEESGSNPFLPPGSSPVLPPELLDSVVTNFIVTSDGLEFIDDEWRAEGGVSLHMIVVRSLCRLAYGLVAGGVPLPWPASASGDMIAETLGHLIGFQMDATDIGKWRAAEAELQAIVYGSDPARSIEALVVEGSTSRLTLGVTRRVPFSALVDDVERLHGQLGDLGRAYHETREAHDRMDADRSALRARIESLTVELDSTRYAVEAHERLAAMVRSDIEQIHELRRVNDQLVHRIRSLEHRLPLRAYRKLKRMAGGGPGNLGREVLQVLRRGSGS